ncbi:hypothetical protein C8R42DRAFT_646167 [Lentinula raphanica]|nr:hypothetical protein C8R42DRAFT_646167 [Lentinula raphanica]
MAAGNDNTRPVKWKNLNRVTSTTGYLNPEWRAVTGDEQYSSKSGDDGDVGGKKERWNFPRIPFNLGLRFPPTITENGRSDMSKDYWLAKGSSATTASMQDFKLQGVKRISQARIVFFLVLTLVKYILFKHIMLCLIVLFITSSMEMNLSQLAKNTSYV